MIRLIIILNFVFLVSNILWVYIGDPKAFYIPLALLLVAFNFHLWKTFEGSRYVKAFLEYFVLLAIGNLIKQIFYSENMRQLNDYYWGGFLSVYLIIKLWLIRTQTSGRKLK